MRNPRSTAIRPPGRRGDRAVAAPTELIVGLDIGTTKVCAIIGEFNETGQLEIIGVGYLAAVLGQVLQLRVGLANELQVPIPAGVKVACPDQQHIVIQGIDKQLVGQFAAEVRARRKPEPYKGKGIRYLGEPVRRKQGKAIVK